MTYYSNRVLRRMMMTSFSWTYLLISPLFLILWILRWLVAHPIRIHKNNLLRMITIWGIIILSIKLKIRMFKSWLIITIIIGIKLRWLIRGIEMVKILSLNKIEIQKLILIIWKIWIKPIQAKNITSLLRIQEQTGLK